MQAKAGKDFIRTIIEQDLKMGKNAGQVVTRFPPEPNGYLHIGHAKSICLNFGIAEDYQGRCHLRFDDTDPVKEEASFEEAIKDAVRWLGFDWKEHLFHASDYFDTLYELACELIKKGKAYVCSLSLEEIRQARGTVTEPGKNSPYRERSIEENLDLFERMKNGEFPDAAHVLRAKIDMAAANMKMRDPLLYRIRHVSHHMTGKKWCIYPLYDFTHCLSDSLEGITHSICTLEFENNRELYDWVIQELDMPNKPRQYEFARLNINYNVMSKRKIAQLIEEGHVQDWDDPRLLTLAGLRRRGYTPQAIRNFCASVGVCKANSVVDIAQLEFAIREDLNQTAPRVLAVLDPLKVTIRNYEGKETIAAPYFPDDESKPQTRELPFSKNLYIDREDFLEKPPKGFYRLSPGKEVRLRHAYIIRCEEVIKDKEGKVCELICSYDEKTAIGQSPADGRRVKGTIQWVSAKEALAAKVRIFDRLFCVENPDNLEQDLNPNSLKTYKKALVEPALKTFAKESRFQFERIGYFVADILDWSQENFVFNQTVALKDSWSKKAEKKPSIEETKKVQKPKKPSKELKKEASKAKIPDQMQQAAEKYQKRFSLSFDYALFFVQHPDLAKYFESTYKIYPQSLSLANYLVNEVAGKLKKESLQLPSSKDFAAFLEMLDSKQLSSKLGKQVFDMMLKSKKSPTALVKELGLEQIDSEQELLALILPLLEKHRDVAIDIKGGREKRLAFFVGQVMKATNGKARPDLLQSLLLREISKI